MLVAPQLDPKTLAAYASQALDRHVDEWSPEISEYQEALDRQTFRHGGRTHDGYYLDVIIVTHVKRNEAGEIVSYGPKARLKSQNALSRMNLRDEY